MPKIKGLEYDQLTGLYNRWKCRQELENILEQGEVRVMGTIDLDNFKAVNETYGTEMGDNLLKAIAQALRLSYPGSDIYRISGDEFGFILKPTTYSRYAMSEMTRTLFNNLHIIEVPGMEGYRLTFSIGSVFIEPQLYENADQIYREVSINRHEAKKHEGNYLYSKYGFIPDIEGSFTILREDRHLYNTINNRLFSIYDEKDWIEYLNEGAKMKGNMYVRNQSQLDDLFAYFKSDDLPSFDYDLLYDLVIKYASSLDAFMFGMLIDDILLPYYEQQDLSDTRICGKLGRLYLMLADSLLSVVRMGDKSQNQRIHDLLAKCREVTRTLDHQSVEFEPYIYSLCHQVGHFESINLEFGNIDEIDQCYEELRDLLTGPEHVVLQDPVAIRHFNSLTNNARFFPLYRTFYLLMKEDRRSEAENDELKRRLLYIRQHIKDGIYDMASDEPEFIRMATYLQELMLDGLNADQMLDRLIKALRTIHQMEYGVLSESNLILVTYIFIGTSKVLLLSSHSTAEKRVITLAGLDLLLDLLRKRESIATDHQLLFMTQSLIRAMVGSPVLTPVDKVRYLERAMGIIMIDTYSHSKAVAAYARIILSNIIDHYPHLLIGENRPYNTIEEVKANRQSLLDFMECACLLHDIGKMRITLITSNTYRKLTDQEFNLIRKHPEEGVKILSQEPAFDVFRPFLITHHLWCNRQAGYPKAKEEDFSPRLQFLVYLLSFCDSLEAATSRIGRNYRNAKNFLQIMDEFYVEAGTRYSDEVLQSIIGSPATYYQIRLMVDHKWQNVYQYIFQEVVLAQSHKRKKSAAETLPDIYANKANEDIYRTQFAMLQRMDILGALVSIFDTVIYTNTEFTHFEMLKGYQQMVNTTKSLKSTHDVIALTRDHLIDPEFREAFGKFTDKNTAIERLKTGVDTTLEYHSKTSGWVLARLLPAAYDEDGNITHILFVSQSSEQEHQQKDRLAKVASIDGLTGVLNRMRGEQMIRAEIAKGGTQIFALLDCDNFKKINDQMSHLVGDQVLREQSRILQDFFEDSMVMRLGGDEFVVYINGKKAHDIVNSVFGVKSVFQDLIKRLSEVRLPELHNIAPTMSCGVVFTDSSVDATFESLYQHADESLRESKKMRGGTITIKELRYMAFFL